MDLKARARRLLDELEGSMRKLNMPKLSTERNSLLAKSRQPDFWRDNRSAQVTMKKISQLEGRVNPWLELERGVRELADMAGLDDKSMSAELEKQYEAVSKKFEALKGELKFSGPYDNHAAVLGIHAGAGGTDAQDWAGMLLRMYLRYCESSGWQAKVVDESAGEEAGIKSATLEIEGPLVYGKLKGEHGVHRLVRLSPFNADNLRQTSFAKVEVSPRIDEPDEAKLDEKDLKIDVYRSGGKGGQSVNTTDSAVRVTHLPTGLTVAIQNERSQLQNKETALTILRSRLAQLQMEQHADKLSELKGPSEQAAWGNQIRSYVLHPYKQVKDLRSGWETTEPDKVLDGQLGPLIDAYLNWSLGEADGREG